MVLSAGRLQGKTAIITGGDSGIGRAVAPGPIWTPLIPASFNEQDTAKFGSNTPMGRARSTGGTGSCLCIQLLMMHLI